MIFNGVMTIWILALILMASAAGLGHRQGAIRAAFSLVGILAAMLLAEPIGHLLQPLLPHAGISNPLLAWVLAPVTGFILVSIAFKIAGEVLHRKIDIFYKYHAGDLRQALWERINARLGLCLGIVNGALYFVLICFVMFNLAYWTTQMSPADKQPPLIKFVNLLGSDLQSTGMAKAAGAVKKLPEMYYKLADLSGLVLQTPQAGPRLAKYPALTSLWERDDMQAMMQSPTLTNAVNNGASLGEIMKDPAVQAFFANKELTDMVWGILQTNIDDLSAYIETGKSAKFDREKILGSWIFNAGVTAAWMHESRPLMTVNETRIARAALTKAYSQMQLLFTGDNKLFIKNLPKFKTEPGQPPAIEFNKGKGEWNHGDTGYILHATASNEEKNWTATIEGDRVIIDDGKTRLAFDHED